MFGWFSAPKQKEAPAPRPSIEELEERAYQDLMAGQRGWAVHHFGPFDARDGLRSVEAVIARAISELSRKG